MALVNQSSHELLGDPGDRLYSDLNQIFPNHKETVIRRVIADLSSNPNNSSLLPRCIDALVNISPSSEWNDGKNRSNKKSKLSPVQEDVVKRLHSMFPHVKSKLIQTSVQHPSNTFEPLSVPTLLQRCIDDLLAERTFLEAYFYNSDDDEDSDEDDSDEGVKNQRMTSNANDFKLLQPVLHNKSADVSATRVITGTAKQMNPALDIRKSLATDETKCTTQPTHKAVNQAASSNGCINDNLNKAKPSVPSKIYISDSITDNTVQKDEPCKVSSADILRQERFSCIDFSDSDSEESKPSSDKTNNTDSEDDLPQICVKTRDRFQSPLSSGAGGSGRQYVSPSKFPAHVSTNTTAQPVVRSIFPSSKAKLVDVKPVMVSTPSTTQSSCTISKKTAVIGAGRLGAGDATTFRQKSSLDLPSTSEGQSATRLPKFISVPLPETPGRKPETTLTSTLSGSIQQTKAKTNIENKTGIGTAGINDIDVTPLPSIFTKQQLPELGKATITSKAQCPYVDVQFDNITTAAASPNPSFLHRMGTSTAKMSQTSTHTANSSSFPPRFTHAAHSSSLPPRFIHAASSSSFPPRFIHAARFIQAANSSSFPPRFIHAANSSSFPPRFTQASTSSSLPSTSSYTATSCIRPSMTTSTATMSIHPSMSTYTGTSISCTPPTSTSAATPSSHAPSVSTYAATSSSHSSTSTPEATSSGSGQTTFTNPLLGKNPYKNFEKDWNFPHFPWNAGSSGPMNFFRTGSRRDPIVVKEVSQSGMQGASTPENNSACVTNNGARVTLQNTIPVPPPANDNTTVTIESLHRITFNGKNPTEQNDQTSSSDTDRQTVNTSQTKPGTSEPAEPTANKTNASMIELVDESSIDSVDSLGTGDVIFDGQYQMPRPAMMGGDSPFDVDNYEPGVVVIDNSPALPIHVDDNSPILPLHVDDTPPLAPYDFPLGYPNAANSRSSKRRRGRKKKLERYTPPEPWTGINHIDPPLPKTPGAVPVIGAEPAVDVDNPTATWNVAADIKEDVIALFPDADVGHIETLCAYHSGPMALNTICNVLLETDYPKKKPAKSTQQEATVTAPPEVAVDYFKDYKSVIIPVSSMRIYQHQAYTLLSNDFCWISGKDIRKVMSLFNNYYSPSYQELALIWKQAKEAAKLKLAKPEANPKYCGLVFTAELEAGDVKRTMNIQLLKNRRQFQTQQTEILPELRKELDFVKIRLAELAKEADYEVAKQLNEQEYEEEGQCIECGCCYGEYSFESMVQCYDGHLFCRECLRQYAKEAVFGQGKVDMKCMTDMCESNFPKSQLEKALPSEVLARYEDRVQEENINLADLGDLVRCPHCDYAALMDNPEDKVFGCLKCGKATCRHCKEDWEEHFGKRCEEIEKKDETKLRLAYEERMTQAKVRTCHKCKAQFTKEDGCNKMTCRCGAKMCYICRKPNIEYTHFCRHPRDPGKECTSCVACSLWTNPEEDDNRAVKEIQKEAIQRRKEQGFTDEKLIGAPDEPPAKKAKR